MNVNEKMVMVVDNKKYCLIGRLEWTVKKEKVRKISYVSLKRVLLFFLCFFLCTIQRREIKIDSLMASPLVLNFGTTRMLPGRSLLVELPLRERIKRFDRGRKWPPPSPFPLSSHTHNTFYTGIYCT